MAASSEVPTVAIISFGKGLEMNRRTLLKCAAGAGTIALASRLSFSTSRAQASWYQGEVIYEFSEFLKGNYDSILDGRATGMSADGVIAGVDRVDGKRIPVTWNLGGERQLVSTGDIEYGDARTLIISKNGMLAGNLSTGTSLTDPMFAVRWQDGQPVLLQEKGQAGEYVIASSITDNGVIGGSVDFAAVRWTAGTPEFLEDPRIETGSSVVELSPAGDGYGVDWNEEHTVPTIWRWSVNGETETLALPEELTAASVLEIPVVTMIGAFDPKTLVVDFWWDEGAGNVTGTWIYRDGVYQRARGTSLGLAMSADLAESPDRLYGDFVENKQSQGYGILDGGSEQLLSNIAVMPDGFFATGFVGVSGDGTIVMSGFNEYSESRPAMLVALRPMS